jgi:DNA-directed RNA polymerase subunit M/transcription elongation factor TFIIS
MDEIKTIREKGINALSQLLKNDQNIRIIEKLLYKITIFVEPDDFGNQYISNLYQVCFDIKGGKLLKDVVDNLKTLKIGWDHQNFDDIKYQILEQDDFIENPFEIEEGVIECKCGSKRVFSYSKQSRSADEPSTTYAECAECNAKWQYSG